MSKVGSRSRHIALVLRTLVTLGALYGVLHFVPLSDVLTAMAAASVPLVVAGIVAQLVLRPINAARIRIVARAQGAPLTFRAIVITLYTTAFYALLLPGSVGGGLATLVKYVGHGATVTAALVSIVVNRVFDTCTTLCVGLFFWALDQHAAANATQGQIAEWLLLLTPLTLLCSYAVSCGNTRVLARIAGLVRRLTAGRDTALRRGINRFTEQLEAAGSLRPSEACIAGLLSLAKDLLGIVAVWCYARACGIDLPFSTIAWINAAVTLLLLLPLTLSGLGVREGALVLISAPHGVAAPLALTWSFLILTGQLIIAAIGGLIEARVFWSREARAT